MTRKGTKENKARTARAPNFYSVPDKLMLPALNVATLLCRIQPYPNRCRPPRFPIPRKSDFPFLEIVATAHFNTNIPRKFPETAHTPPASERGPRG